MTDQNTTAHLYARDGFGRITGDIIGNFGAGVDTTVARIGRVFEPRGMLQEITSYSDSAGATPVNDVYRLFNDFAQMTDEYQMHTQMAVDSGAADAPYIHYDYSGGSGNTIRGTDEQYFFNLSGTRTIAFGYSGPDDSLSRISSLTSTGGGTAASGTVSQLTYLGLDAIVTENYPQPDVNLDYTGGTAANYSGLDNFDRVAMQLWTQPSSLSTFDQFNYTYALAGNRTTRGNAVAAAYMRYLDEQYSYDHLYRVNVANRGQLSSSGTIAAPLHKENWTLDATGNWNTYSNSSSWASLSQTRSFNRANQITAISGSGSAPTAYDNNGNMTQLPFVPTGSSAAVNGSGTYDAWNRLMTTSGGTACTFAYDGLHRRIQKTIGGATTDFYLDGQRVAESDYTPSGGTSSLQHQFIWSQRYIDAPILRDDFTPGTTFARLYYLDDANFNVTTVMGFALTSGDWEPLERYVYDAYGKPIFFNGDWSIWHATSAVHNTTLFTGRELDPADGLYYYHARYFSSLLGCFLGRDSSDGNGNLYQYCQGSPASFNDPDGNECRAFLIASPVLATQYHHVCIQVERDVVRQELQPRTVWEHTGIFYQQDWRDPCGYIHSELQEQLRPTTVYDLVARADKEVWSVELLSAIANPPGGVRTGWGKTGTVGNILAHIPFIGMRLTEKTGWGIWLTPQPCSALTEGVAGTTATQITPSNQNVSTCDIVDRVKNSAWTVGQAAQRNDAQYFLKNSRGQWLGDAANTCNSAASEVLGRSGGVDVTLPAPANQFPGWGHGFSDPNAPHMVPFLAEPRAATYPGR